MTILLLRHVEAGDRDAWDGDDRTRPASPLGRRQADALIAQLADHAIDRIVTSPYTRCVDSVLPLAATRELHVEPDEVLAEGSPTDVIRALLRGLDGQDILLCSHGDVIGAAITDLDAQGVDVGSDATWPKGSTWLLSDLTGTAPSARYLPPPA